MAQSWILFDLGTRINSRGLTAATEVNEPAPPATSSATVGPEGVPPTNFILSAHMLHLIPEVVVLFAGIVTHSKLRPVVLDVEVTEKVERSAMQTIRSHPAGALATNATLHSGVRDTG